MKIKKISMLISIICVIALAGCSGNSSPSESSVSTGETSSTPPPTPTPSSDPAESQAPEEFQEDDTMSTVNIQVGNKNFTAIMYDNESAQAIFQEMPFTLEMNDYASQEKVAELTFDLPSAVTETPAAINAGDMYLWSGNNLVLFYTTFSNSYSYVPVGYIEDITGLQDALGSGSVEVTFQK
ncbi:cyclophilin-like fold protein [Faecalicatena contorta]|uniref:Cyclophilin-like domain-containing protein n=1 Tax=Faecalicatena contorta TaxID=39482 RepID=A0A316A0W8_9FIRM|nr:cyclophilin-like fold protein [Faecalicatena contorta]PWJ51491.1 hypothetical protein A8805_102264 [Faecalicatena contorta]SUQ13047.1 hypothetical protein SAMN05216529_102264 [Faecalicatena contorta]